MKVFICKSFNDKGIEDRIIRLISREKKKADNSLRIFCVHEPIQKRLEAAGIPSEAFYEFNRFDYEDEAIWEKAYEISDSLYASIGDNDSLKFSVINFLSFEHCPIYYISSMRLSNLFRLMAAENCDVLIIVIPQQYSQWLRDINSRNIITIKHGNTIQSFLGRLGCQVWQQSAVLFQVLFNTIKSPLKKSGSPDLPVVSPEVDNKRSKALFTVSTSLYARPALAIAQTCLKNDILPYFVTDDNTQVSLFQSLGVGYTVKPRFSGLMLSLSLRAGGLLALFFRLKRHVNLFFDSHYPEIKQDEFSVEHMFKKTLLASLPWLCYEAITNIVFLEKQIKTMAPDIVCVMPQSQQFQQMASALAKKYNNTPTLACSAAWETGSAGAFLKHLHADIIATSGEKMKSVYISSGLEPGRVLATGIAHFDRMFNRDRESDKQILSACGINPRDGIVVFTTDNISLRETEEMLAGVIDAVLKMKDIQLVIKVHPRESAEPYFTIADRYHNPKIRVVKDIDLYALLGSCELLITKFSMTALEAMIIDKPVVTINLSGKPIPAVPYAEEGASIGVNRRQDIEPAIQKALYNEETRTKLKVGRDRFVRNWAGEPDGKASQRIVTLMKNMITESRRKGRQ